MKRFWYARKSLHWFRSMILCLSILVVVGTNALGSPDGLASLINQNSYKSYLNSLYTSSGNNRGLGGAEHDLARTYIQNQFTSFGLSTSLDPFAYSGSTYYNVVARLAGKVHPDQYYVVGAHYDSANTPGANDNASGVAGVLEMARALSSYSFDRSLLFIAFDREEQGLVGSTHYAAAHRTDSILGMISLDMIAYTTAVNSNGAYVYGRNSSVPLQSSLAASLANYGIIAQLQGQMDRSDHAPFELQGFMACLLIEGSWTGDPNYHRSTDSIDTAGYIDYAFGTSMTRGVTYFLADKAGEISAVPLPASAWFMISGIMALAAIRRRRRGRCLK